MLPNWTLLPVFDVITLFREVSIGHLQLVWLANKGRLPFRTPGPVPFGTCFVLMLRPFFPEFVMSTDLFEFRTSLGTPILLFTHALYEWRGEPPIFRVYHHPPKGNYTVISLFWKKRKGERSDSVLWQKPLHPQKNPKSNVTIPKRHQKLRLHNDWVPT